MVLKGLCEVEKVHLNHTFGICTFTGISPQLRKIAIKLKQKKVIEQRGDQYFIKSTSTFRNYNIAFRVGQEFEEFTKGLDNRHVKVKMDDRMCSEHFHKLRNKRCFVTHVMCYLLIFAV